ncbi:hypothetical protein J2129_002187 [Methanofollis sp. W23]|nr:hypothetical protein [Methanofollis sp. W23]
MIMKRGMRSLATLHQWGEGHGCMCALRRGEGFSTIISLDLQREKQESSGIASERWTLPPHGESFFFFAPGLPLE